MTLRGVTIVGVILLVGSVSGLVLTTDSERSRWCGRCDALRSTDLFLWFLVRSGFMFWGVKLDFGRCRSTKDKADLRLFDRQTFWNVYSANEWNEGRMHFARE